jgi:hypothetical protein
MVRQVFFERKEKIEIFVRGGKKILAAKTKIEG